MRGIMTIWNDTSRRLGGVRFFSGERRRLLSTVTATTTLLASQSTVLLVSLSSAQIHRAAAFSTGFTLAPRIRTLRQPGLCLQTFYANPLSDEGMEDNDSETSNVSQSTNPTRSYVPYNPNQPKASNSINNTRRQYFSTWTIPKSVDIPQDKLDIQFVRSSGAGGQNVNKVNTKVEIRMDVPNATWLPEEVRTRLAQQQANRINKEGILSLTSQEFRTQGQNKRDALHKLQSMILEAWERPKIRKQRTGISKAAKERNKDFKKMRSQVKQNRRKVDW
jgi:peptidyl-tRNA hydrolase ICT1